MTDGFKKSARRLVSDETFTEAVQVILARMNKDLLNAKTPEDRERKFQEYDALRRVENFLKVQAEEAE